MQTFGTPPVSCMQAAGRSRRHKGDSVRGGTLVVSKFDRPRTNLRTFAEWGHLSALHGLPQPCLLQLQQFAILAAGRR